MGATDGARSEAFFFFKRTIGLLAERRLFSSSLETKHNNLLFSMLFTIKAKGFSSLDDFNKKNVILAARMGTTAEQAARKYMPDATLRLFENESQALQELNLGRVHAVVSSAPMPIFHALKYPEKLFVPIKENFTKEPIGFAIKKSDHDALNFLNNWILNMHASGFLKEKKAYWFESKEWEKLVK